MIGKSYFLLSLLQVGLSQEWKGDTPREVIAQEGSCVQIPCNYTYPAHLVARSRVGIWYMRRYWETWSTWSTAFHSVDHSHELPRFRHRTRLSGDLKDGDCSLIINNISREDAEPYFFRIEFDSRNSYNYLPETKLHVSVGLSQEWKGDTPREVTAQEGSCVQIPCHYSYPSCLENQPRGGVWFHKKKQVPWAPITFYTKDHNHELPRFRYRTRLSGDMKDGDCSLIINNIRREDAGLYFFRIEFDNGPSHNYYPITQLHVSGRDSSKWTLGLLTAGIMLSVFLVGIFIFICVRKRKTVTEERVSGTSDIALTPSPLSVKHQGKQNVLITEPRDTARDTTSEGETPAPRDLSEGPVGSDAGHGNPDNPDALLYINVNFSKLPSGDRTVHRSEDTEYAQIRFQKN
ncbi:sialic acid-binding Ig-like lectin 12 isoform X3 [Cetorhinus maximus]